MARLRRSRPVEATVGDREVVCLVCGAGEFWSGRTVLSTALAQFVGLGWADRGATSLICTSCGFVHEFAGDVLQLWQ